MGNIDSGFDSNSTEESITPVNAQKYLRKGQKKVISLEKKIGTLKNELEETDKRTHNSKDPKLEKARESIVEKISQLEEKKQDIEVEIAELQNGIITEEVAEMQVFFGQSEKEKKKEMDEELMKGDRMEEFRNLLDYRLQNRGKENMLEKRERTERFEDEYNIIEKCKSLISRAEVLLKERENDIEIMKKKENPDLEGSIKKYEYFTRTYEGYKRDLMESIDKQENIIFTFDVYSTSSFWEEAV